MWLRVVQPRFRLERHSLTGWACSIIVGALGWQLAEQFSYRFFFLDAAVLHVGLAALVLAGALLSLRTQHVWIIAPMVLWFLWTLLSITWSVGPADSVRAAAWHFIYLAAFAVGLVWPRQLLISLMAANITIFLSGLDIHVITDWITFVGLWYNKNVQGAHFLLFVPSLLLLMLRHARLSPYLGLLAGTAIFSALLTQSFAAQALLFITIVIIALRAPHLITWPSRRLQYGLVSIASVITGFALTWAIIQPVAVQVLGIGIGIPPGAEAPLDKTNTESSLSHRLEMITYTAERGLVSQPLGTGAGTFQYIYPGLKKQAGVNVADPHNYYVETFMTLGLPGLLLLVWTIAAALLRSFRARRWYVIIPLFLFGGYLAFDMPAVFPSIMMLFFGLAGIAHSMESVRLSEPTVRLHVRLLFLVPVAFAPFAWSWWMQPCDEPECALDRRLADYATSHHVVGSLQFPEQLQFVDRVIVRNPESLWAYELKARILAAGDDDRAYHEFAKDMVKRFPFANRGVYETLVDAARRLDDPEQVASAETSLRQVYGAPLPR